MSRDSFRLITYAAQHNTGFGYYETVWNGRPGDAPTTHIGKGNIAMIRVDPECELYAPKHVPNVGDPIFVEPRCDPEMRIAIARDQCLVEARWRMLDGKQTPDPVEYQREVVKQLRTIGLMTIFAGVNVQREFMRRRKKGHPLLASVTKQLEEQGSVYDEAMALFSKMGLPEEQSWHMVACEGCGRIDGTHPEAEAPCAGTPTGKQWTPPAEDQGEAPGAAP